MSTCALPRVPLTWSFIQCGGSHSAVTQLRVILSCGPSGSWVDVLGANSCASITGYLPWGISTLLSYHARGSPLVVALSRVVSVPGCPKSGVDTSWVRASPSGARLAALKPPFSSPYYCSGHLRPEASSATPLSLGRCFSLGDASLWATPHFGRRLTWAMPPIGDDSRGRPTNFSSLGPSKGPHHALTLTFGQRPMTGRYNWICANQDNNAETNMSNAINEDPTNFD